ncbi:hypothetical protein AMATHDRAFT_10502 [Amanita thiersii Skay4041]|uniref:Reverse transcriptase Ty1/copia-type domain-containing protein n=1 Tax=Amanita thiersii Skay4041 TaxID=703135 RepID=A0A2A9NAZ1_9AGAR|nr:hypothetical protein AMATHDRAFT_10502 [Amanita thiersii Skay4041]
MPSKRSALKVQHLSTLTPNFDVSTLSTPLTIALGYSGPQASLLITSSSYSMCLSDTTRQLIWFQLLFKELSFDIPTISLCGDNQGAIFLASNPALKPKLLCPPTFIAQGSTPKAL